MPKINHPADYAITVANDEDRTYYFNDQEKFEDFARGLLVSEDTSRISPTDFKMFERTEDTWIEVDFDPYDLVSDSDDMPFSLAHEQLLGNFADTVDHKILWDIAQGYEDAIALILSASLRARMRKTYAELVKADAWGELESEKIESDSDDLSIGNWLFKYGYEVRNERKAARKLSSQLGNWNSDEDEDNQGWVTEI